MLLADDGVHMSIFANELVKIILQCSIVCVTCFFIIIGFC